MKVVFLLSRIMIVMKQNHQPSIPRRSFLKQAGSGMGLLILPSGMGRGESSPGEKLNIALIGVGGRGISHFNAVANENIVALCDVDANAIAAAAGRFPGASHYQDWRKCLDHKRLDAVVCSTTDHTHAHIAIWAMLRGLHVYCEKPLAISVEEARLVRETYRKNRDKVATQVGTQLHARAHFREVSRLIREGAVGELRAVSAWGDRKLPKAGHPPLLGSPPDHLNYDLWLGPAPFHPYHPDYFASVTPGANCLNWNMFSDFGSGQAGDMGSHTMDFVWNAIEASGPLRVSASGDPHHPEVTPVKMHAKFRIPANDWRDAIDLCWHQGGSMPDGPTDSALRGIGHGAMFTGSTGVMVADFGSYGIIPHETPRDTRISRTPTRGDGNHLGEWIAACKGDLKTSCDFDYGSRIIETMMLGLVAHQAGEILDYDMLQGKITNSNAAGKFMSRTYRDGWPLVG